MTERQYAFDMLLVQADGTGYYHPRWDRATPVTVVAANRDEAYKAAGAIMGASPRGWSWRARIESIRDVRDAGADQ